ncbi:MAG: deoxyhypusine synthase [Candidatus Woesearchaeota archaeon]
MEETKFSEYGDIHVRKYDTLEGFPEIKGYDFDEEFDFDRFMESFKNMGIQATNLGTAIDIVNQMIDDNATIFLTCTSNMVSSGNREIIRFLVKHKMVHALSISEGGIEEDVIKCLKPFIVGRFDIPGRALFDKSISRIGNIFVPLDRYAYFETFLDPFLDRIYDDNKKTGKPLTPSKFIYELGREMERLDNKEESILYWAYKNDIPVFCPALTDGTIGNFLYVEMIKKKDFYMDIVADHKKIIDFVLSCEKTGAIILGGGVSKHYVLNANIYREGLDYAVYITTADESDASDSGGNQQEAMTWAKLKLNAPNVKVKSEASIVFPLLVAATFGKRKSS